jgi:Fic family protein
MDRDAPPVRFADLATRAPFPAIPQPDTRAYELLLGGYRPWRKVRPIARDLGMNPEEAWAMVKASRLPALQQLEVRQADGQPFRLCMGPHVLEPLHRVDRASGGGGPAALEPERGDLGDPAVRERLRIKTLMDEAAESSLIEGAATTRADAVELLRSGRSPRTRAERMVVNNYLAMQRVKGWLGRDLTPDMLLELQTLLTDGTLDRPDEAGRLRREGEFVRVVDERTNEPIFVPPPAGQLPARLRAVCDFANADHGRGPRFIHPVVKACVLHFLVGYEHPFCDGNGRTARAVFYWHALRHGYHIFEYTAISELIRAGFARYPQAYIDAELDEGDLTYFVLYQLEVIERALGRLAEHIRDEQARIERSASLLRLAKDLNLRQRLLLEHALRRPTTEYTVKSHMNSNGVVAATARTDLEDLVRRRMLLTSRRGNQVVYTVVPGLADRLERSMAKGRTKR